MNRCTLIDNTQVVMLIMPRARSYKFHCPTTRLLENNTFYPVELYT